MRRHLKQGSSGFYIETEPYVLRSTLASRLVPSMNNLIVQNLQVCPVASLYTSKFFIGLMVRKVQLVELILPHVCSTLLGIQPKLYIPSTVNIDLILWNT